MIGFDNFKSAIPGHWTNGGTGVTNFERGQVHLYERALREHGDKDLSIHYKPFGSSTIKSDYSLHCSTGYKDFSPFWAVFNRIQQEENQ
jgi:hypothetical protein